MGAKPAKIADVDQLQINDAAGSSTEKNPKKLSQKELHSWRKQLTSTVEKLQKEVERKDARIAELSKQVRNSTARSGTKSIEVERQNASESKQLVEKLQDHVKKLEKTIEEKNELIGHLRRQLSESKYDKDSQVAAVKESVEMVIHEKDSEIRRLKALWSPNEACETEMADTLGSLEDVPHAAKLLNAPELGQGKSGARFGISAENRISSFTNVEKEGDVKPKTFAQIDFIRKALNRNIFLKGLDNSQVDYLIEFMTLKVIGSGANVITEGEFGNHMYVLEKGQVEVFHAKSGTYNHVVDLKCGAVFGELAILYNCKRTASVKAKTDVQCWCLDRRHFQTAVKKSGQQKRQEYVRLLKTVEKLESLSENKLMRIADCLEETSFTKGDYIIRQGGAGDTFYILQSGKVKVTQSKKQDGKSKSYEETFVAYLEAGQYFGEGALLTEEKRSANIIVESSDVTVLMLDRQAFYSFVGSIADLARSPASGNQMKDDKIRFEFGSDDNEEFEELEYNSNNDAVATRFSKGTEATIVQTKLNQLKTLRILGQGGFGCVKLVAVPGLPKHAFALKAIRKAKIIESGQEQHVLAEKNIMLAIKSPFLGKLHRTYKDDWCVYFLMDAYLGGEVFGLLKREGPLPEKIARFCAACVLEALDYLHKKEVVYRDLKPENLMIDHTGYVKLVDFGFAKHIIPGYKTWTFCGTPEYFPPEVLLNLGHDISADIWSYGVLIYELLSRTTPFIAEDDMSVYENILNGLEGVKFSKFITKPAEALIRGLCKTEPHDRLGFQKAGFGDVRKHRWFQGFDWQGLRSHRLISPIEIEVKSPTDTNNFDIFDEVPVNLKEERKILAEVSSSDWDSSF